MHRVFALCVGGILGSILLSATAFAGSRNSTDYPLRIHIFQFNGYSHYYRPGGYTSSLDDVDGEGRANLYENSQPSAVDFSYHCSHRLMVSPGFETYMARWKKPGRELEVLFPILGGKPGEMSSCDLEVTMKPDSAYFQHNGPMGEEPAALFKAWMVKHEYDPERGKNVPVFPTPEPASSSPPAAAPAPSQQLPAPQPGATSPGK